MLNASQIATLINEIYEGVERSKLGKIMEDVPVSNQYPEGKKINTIPMNTYIAVLNSLIPKDIKGDIKATE